MSKRPLPSAENRLISGRYSQAPTNELFGCIPRLSLNNIGPLGSRKDCLYNAQGELSLHGNAFWDEECGGYISTDGHTYV